MQNVVLDVQKLLPFVSLAHPVTILGAAFAKREPVAMGTMN